MNRIGSERGRTAAMRMLYTLIAYLLVPAVVVRLFVRSLRAPAYRRRMGERFGWVRPVAGNGAIWIHAVSVGETQAALPLVNALHKQAPKRPIVVTCTTPTGSEHVRRNLGDDVAHYYLPYDLPGALRRFMDAVRPALVVIMETEIWPNLYRACEVRNVPLVIANGRLSPGSVRRYAWLGPFVASTLARATLICAQSDTDARRFRELGAPPERVFVLGSIKFDLEVAENVAADGRALRRLLGNDRPVWIAASTHDGEERQVLEAYTRVRQRLAECLLIIVPRHPERFTQVETLCTSLGWRTARRSVAAGLAECDIYLGDTMGELLILLAASDVAFMGGSLVPVGGHNVLEAAALGRPVQIGPHTFGIADAAERLISAGGAQRVRDAAGLGDSTVDLLLDPQRRRQMGEAARTTVEVNRGALERLLHVLGDLL